MKESDKPDNESEALDKLRAEIDAVDADLLALLEQRYSLTSKAAASKRNQRIFRPGREADLIRSLVAKSSLDPLLVESIWRRIIAFSLDGQKRLRIALSSGGAVERAARFRFGAVAEYTAHDTAGAVIEAVVKEEADIGILPHWRQEDWWRDLAERRGRGEDVYIASTSPMQPAPGLDPVALLARDLPDPSEKDVTLVHDTVGVEEKDGYAPSSPNLLGIIQQS